MTQPISKGSPLAEDSTDSTHLEKLDNKETLQEHIPISPALDRAISRKFDKRIVPWLFGLWLLAFIDRSNIGNAKIDGLAAELDLLKGDRFNTALAIFYVPYICVDGGFCVFSFFLFCFVCGNGIAKRLPKMS